MFLMVFMREYAGSRLFEQLSVSWNIFVEERRFCLKSVSCESASG